MSICDDNSEMSHHHIGVTSHSCTFLVCNCNDCLAWTWKRSGRTAMSLAWLPWPGYGSQIPCHLMTAASHHVLHMDIWLALIQLAQDRVLHKFIKNHGYCTVLPSLQWILLTKRDSLQEIMSINSYDQHECINRHTLQPCTDFLCAANFDSVQCLSWLSSWWRFTSGYSRQVFHILSCSGSTLTHLATKQATWLPPYVKVSQAVVHTVSTELLVADTAIAKNQIVCLVLGKAYHEFVIKVIP